MVLGLIALKDKAVTADALQSAARLPQSIPAVVIGAWR